MRRWILPNAHTTNTGGIMTDKIQMLLGDLKRETKRYQDLISAQTERLTYIKNQIDLELQKKHLKTNDKQQIN